MGVAAVNEVVCRFVVPLLMSTALVAVHCATLWFEDPPSLDDPCTIVIPPAARGSMVHLHPPAACADNTGIMWYATYGRIHLYLYYDTDPSDSTRRDFELCLTAGLPDRVYIFWDSRNDSWNAISFPIWHAQTYKTDRCRTSKNGTMDLYLEPPWAFVNYVSHLNFTITFVDQLVPDAVEARPMEDRDGITGDSGGGHVESAT